MKTLGIGGSTIEAELAAIEPMAHLAKPIQSEEFNTRLNKAISLMKKEGVAALYVHAGTNLFYFTGTKWGSSERMVGALILPNGKVHYVAPEFERGTILDFMGVEGTVEGWEEHESPYALLVSVLKNNGISSGNIAVLSLIHI